MGNVTFGVPEDLALDLKQALNCNVFIETGTYKGNTAIWAHRFFLKVYTIEFDKQRYEKTRIKISNMIDTSNIRMFQGNSKDVLPDVLAKINEPVIFWLDAHGLGKLEETTTIEDEIPLMQELSVIFDWQQRTNQECVILIDDARLFINPPPIDKGYHPEFWPNDMEIAVYAEKNGFSMLIGNDVIALTPNSDCYDIVVNWRNNK